MKLLFKNACKEDVVKLIEVQNESFKDDYIMYGECPAYNETEEAIARQIREYNVYKIIVDEEIIGDIIVRERENKNYYLRVLSIIPKWQGYGIGAKAIEFIEKDNPDALEWELVTPFKSERNNHFYKKMGYEKIGERIHSDILTLCEYKKTIDNNS